MKHVLKSRYRYPLFALGLFLIELGGLLLYFLKIPMYGVEIFAIIGFIIFLSSFLA
ncbi:hypothetical protein OXIME_000357 [Oxyplasma meridianum]|uniref:Uncharacterized protein n=1 Tax=Oxyplasma meridianum TaxID=3073602 RepID=A0AAX4NEA6_9ARCH